VTAPWLTAISVPHLARAVAVAGADPAPLLARFAVPADPRYEDRISIATACDLWEAAIELTGRRDLAALAAANVVHDERSLVGFVVANQRRLGDGVMLLDRYYDTVSNGYAWRARIDDAHVRLVATPPGPIHRLGWQAYLEFEVMDSILIGQRLTGGKAQPSAVRYLHPAPAPEVVTVLAGAHGVVPAFSAPACEIEWPSTVADLPIASARPSIARLVEERLAAMLDAIHRGHDVSARARAALATLMRDGSCDVPALARALRMSRRSLERALAEEGTSASALIEDERKQLALAWLPELSVDEVAARLGYSDARAFARAFKRWTGRAPSAVRKAATTASR
jgi:AraC-like DNA-binding protein